MNKVLYYTVIFMAGAAIGGATAPVVVEHWSKSQFTNRGNVLEKVGSGFASCPIENLTKAQISIEVVSSKFTSGTYFAEPKGKALLSCGDKVKIVGKGFTAKLTLLKPIAVQVTEKALGTEI